VTAELFIAFVIFALALLLTPGPANLALLVHGSHHGFVRTLPFLTGVSAGKLILHIGVGLGIATVLETVPLIFDGLRVVSVAYILWLGWQWIIQPPRTDGTADATPLGWMHGVPIHLLNPKAWVMSLTAYAEFVPPLATLPEAILWVAGTYLVLQVFSNGLWALGGARLLRRLGPRHLHNAQIILSLVMIVVTLYVVVIV